MIFDGQPRRQTGGQRPHACFPFPVPRAGAGHDDKSTCLRLPAQRLLDGADEIVRERRADHVRRQGRPRLQVLVQHRHVHDRDSREQLRPVPQNEIQGLVGRDHQDFGRLQRVLIAKVCDEGSFVGCATEPRLIQVFDRNGDREVGSRGEAVPQAAVALEVPRQQPAIRIEHQDVVGRLGQGSGLVSATADYDQSQPVASRIARIR